MASDPTVARAAMKAALARIELVLVQNGLASNQLAAAIAHMLAGDLESADISVAEALQTLSDAREAAQKIGIYATQAFG